MRRAVATVMRVTGICNAGYRLGDKVVINLDNICIDKEESDSLCIFAVSAILANMSRTRGAEETLASCPDPATGLAGMLFLKLLRRYSAMKVLVGPSRIFGTCPAGHQIGDQLVIERTLVHKKKGPLCYVAMSAFTAQVTQIQRGERVTSHLSCPSCCFNSHQENRVVFVLSREDVWGLSKKYSKYNWARIDGRETKASKDYCNLCWKLTQEGNFTEAERAIEQAIEHLKPRN